MALMETTDDIFFTLNNMIKSSAHKDSALLKVFIEDYKSFVPDFDEKKLNKDLCYFYLGTKDLFLFNIEEYRTYIHEERGELVRLFAFLKQQEIKYNIFYQPIILYLFYLQKYHQISLDENWPSNSEVKEAIFLYTGTTDPHS